MQAQRVPDWGAAYAAQAQAIIDNAEADRTGIHHDDDDAPRAWPFVWIIISIALLIAALVAFGGPSAQQEAEDVADDAATAQLQAAIDARCHSRAVHEQLACAVDALAEMQPDRWTPEEVARGHEAARIAGAER